MVQPMQRRHKYPVRALRLSSVLRPFRVSPVLLAQPSESESDEAMPHVSTNELKETDYLLCENAEASCCSQRSCRCSQCAASTCQAIVTMVTEPAPLPPLQGRALPACNIPRLQPSTPHTDCPSTPNCTCYSTNPHCPQHPRSPLTPRSPCLNHHCCDLQPPSLLPETSWRGGV